MMRYLIVVLFCMSVLGCSTIHTLNNSEDGLVMQGSYCEDIEHIFSGLQYNWCKLNGTPKNNADPNSAKGDFEYVGIDSLFSFVADVIVLPYTIYKQVSSEPIVVRSSN